MLPLGLTFGAMTGFYLSAVDDDHGRQRHLLQCTATIWTIPLSAWLLRERPDRRSIVGITLASVGLVAIVFYGYDGRPNEGQGIALGLASGVGYAGVVVELRGFRDLDPIWLSSFNNLAASVTLGIWIWLTRGTISAPPPSTLSLLIVFGTIQMAILYLPVCAGSPRHRVPRGRPPRSPRAGALADLGPPRRR